MDILISHLVLVFKLLCSLFIYLFINLLFGFLPTKVCTNFVQFSLVHNKNHVYGIVLNIISYHGYAKLSSMIIDLIEFSNHSNKIDT